MKNLTFFAVLMLNMQTINLYACEDVRLDLDPLVLGNVPPGDQGKTSACFAEAATQLIDAYRFSKGDKERDFISSPLILGSQAGDLLSDGGTIERALDVAKESGTCNRKDVLINLGAKNETEFLELLDEYYGIAQGRNKRDSFALGGSKIDAYSSKMQNFSDNNNALYSATSQSVTFESWSDRKSQVVPTKKVPPKKYSQLQRETATKLCLELINGKILSPGLNTLLRLLDGTRTNFVKEVLASLCKKKKELSYLPKAKTEDFWVETNRSGYLKPPTDDERIKSLRTVIENQLTLKKQPIAIEFCNETVTSSKHEGKYNEKGEWVCQENGGHAAVIVGSKKNIIGQCSYLVRDSYCSQYPKQSNKLSRFGAASKSEVCTKGQYWISSDQLLKNTRAVVHY